MRHQTKPFIVERKPSRKPKSDAQKSSIWGNLDLELIRDHQVEQGRMRGTTGGDDKVR